MTCVDEIDAIVLKLKEAGNLCFKQKNYRDAIEKYTEGITLDPTNAILYCNRSAAYSGMDLEKYLIPAIQDAEKAVDLDPNYAKAYYRLGWICQNQNAHGKSILNYQRAVNCINVNAALKNKCLQEIKKVQSKGTLTTQAHVLYFQEFMALNHLEKHKMKRKYKDQIMLESFGYRGNQIPPYSGSEENGEIEMSLYEILNETTMMYQMVLSNPESAVKAIDDLLSKKKNNEVMDNQKENDKNSENLRKSKRKKNKNVSHAKKYAKIKKLQNQKKELEDATKKADDLEMKGIFGQMIFNFKREIAEIEKAVKLNESDDVWEEKCEQDEWNPEFMDNIYGVPDEMAKRLLFEHRMLPWDEKANTTIAKMYNW